jgi:hypothetical protein
MKKLLLILLITGCTNNCDKEEINPIAEVRFSLDGFGIESHSFARTVDDWDHVLSDGVCFIESNKIGGGYQSLETTYSNIQNETMPLDFGYYYFFIAQNGTDLKGLTLEARSDTITVNDNDVITMSLSTSQALLLIDTDIVCVDSIPTVSTAKLPMSSSNGFYYMYVPEVDTLNQYIINFCSPKGPKEFNIVGAERETIYYISIDGVTFNLPIDSLFTTKIITG